MILDILYYSKERTMQIALIDVLPFADDVADSAGHKALTHEISIVRDFSKAPETMQADLEHINSALVNILDNAVDACIEDKSKPGHTIHFKVKQDEHHVIFEIHDNGIGMDRETREIEEEGQKHRMTGNPVAEFSLKSLKDKEYSSAQFKGKITIIDFWASWCPPCKAELPHIESLYQDIIAEKDIELITITSDNRQKAFEFIEESGYSFPVLIDNDGNVAQDFQLKSIPRAFVIDKQGEVYAVYIGYYENIEQILIDDIKKLGGLEYR